MQQVNWKGQARGEGPRRERSEDAEKDARPQKKRPSYLLKVDWAMLDAQGTRMLSVGSEATDRRGDAVPWHPGTPLADVVSL